MSAITKRERTPLLVASDRRKGNERLSSLRHEGTRYLIYIEYS